MKKSKEGLGSTSSREVEAVRAFSNTIISGYSHIIHTQLLFRKFIFKGKDKIDNTGSNYSLLINAGYEGEYRLDKGIKEWLINQS